jgi:ketosteroid isomerase-like protein
VLANDERAVALYTARAERDGRAYEDETVLVFRIRDGKGVAGRSMPLG